MSASSAVGVRKKSATAMNSTFSRAGRPPWHWPGDHRVGADEKEHLDGVGFSFEDGVPDALRLDDGKAGGKPEAVSSQALFRLFGESIGVGAEMAHVD